MCIYSLIYIITCLVRTSCWPRFVSLECVCDSYWGGIDNQIERDHGESCVCKSELEYNSLSFLYMHVHATKNNNINTMTTMMITTLHVVVSQSSHFPPRRHYHLSSLSYIISSSQPQQSFLSASQPGLFSLCLLSLPRTRCLLTDLIRIAVSPVVRQ